ncbi:hypothetical protein PVAND_001162 [Polypedilum vanderplanki]|uniref:Large ribosomal subunit protein bL27m n=1 Tax=Polypedilum vanderplanki TaxID=319348 RepID=A0A9J6BMH6_POLVA|nr:hypothetical protein PVAND_001162 [Polypedilum vanderplanki]
MNFLNNFKNLLQSSNVCTNIVRNASKKTSGSTRNPKNPHGRPKHRGWKRQEGHYVTSGTILATQLKPRFFPGLNVGYGRNTLFAMTNGRVYVSCEKVDLNWDHSLVQKHFAGRHDQTIYKKYFNVVPEPQHQRFRLVDEN